jgi:hypothetical protein
MPRYESRAEEWRAVLMGEHACSGVNSCAGKAVFQSVNPTGIRWPVRSVGTIGQLFGLDRYRNRGRHRGSAPTSQPLLARHRSDASDSKQGTHQLDHRVRRHRERDRRLRRCRGSRTGRPTLLFLTKEASASPSTASPWRRCDCCPRLPESCEAARSRRQPVLRLPGLLHRHATRRSRSHRRRRASGHLPIFGTGWATKE